MMRIARVLGVLLMGASAVAALGDVFEDYESFSEGFLGESFSHNGVDYVAANDVSGVFPDGSTFVPADIGTTFTIEKATLFYNDFPGYGSPNKSLMFSGVYVPGDNLSIGALASVDMKLAEASNAASLQLGYYENGPWGGIVYHLDALLGDTVVDSDTFVISDLGGRDNPTYQTMSVAAPQFDGLHLYATWGDDYTAPRGMIDNLTVTAVPEPATLSAGVLGTLLMLRRRR